MRILKDDICRCHDDDCKEHERCLRWTQRCTGSDRMVHSESLRHGDPCPMRIPTEEKNADANA